MSDPQVVADHGWFGQWLTAAEVLDIGAAADLRRVEGTLVPGLRDHHVHLGLVDRRTLSTSALGAVDDLGWVLSEALNWKAQPPGACRVRVAGPFLTAVGGYPSGRSWAPDDAVLQIASPDQGSAAVRRLVDAGVDLIKVALHTGLALLGDAELSAIIRTAHELGTTVVVHVEGPGQAARAHAAGADTLAHTPWTETLPDELIMAMAATMTWISTLAIHRPDTAARRTAVDNIARFHRAGGRVRYGTDMGNGPTPVGVNSDELAALVEAGLDPPTILDAIATVDDQSGVLTWTPQPPPEHASELPAWFATLRRRTVADLEGTR